MSSTRTFIANAEKIEDALNKASKCKDCRESLRILETLQTDPQLKEFLTQASNQRDKLKAAYNTLIHTFTTELYQLSQYIAGQLDELDNVKTDDNSPASHTNASTAFSNLSRYLVNDILSAPDAELRVLALKRWLNILDTSMNLSDFHSAAAIYAGLNDSALGRLKTIFMHLNDNEIALMNRINETFILDQGWKLMNERLESSDRNYFIPSFAGIKKAATKAKEARQAHSMHSEFLESQGKLVRSAAASAASAANPDTQPPAKKTPLELFTELVAELKETTRIKYPHQLTELQRDIILANPAETIITVRPLINDEHICYATASNLEREEIPNVLRRLQAQLHQTLSFLADQKKLPEPLKTIKKKLRGFPLDQITSTSFGASEACTTLKKMLTELDTQTKTPKTPRLLRTSTRSKLTESEETALPELAAILRMVTKIDEFTKRHERLMRESSASTTSMLSSVSSTSFSAASAAASLTTPSQSNDSNTSDYISSQIENEHAFDSDTDRELSSSSLAASITTQLSQFSFTGVPPVKIDAADAIPASTSPLKETKSIHKRDAASEKGLLSRHGSMSMTPRKGSPNLSATPQGSPKRSPQGSPGTTKNKK